MKTQIVEKYKQIIGGADNEMGLVELEAERVRKNEIREIYLRCDIKNVNPMKYGIKSFELLLEHFYDRNIWKIYKLYNELLAYGDLINSKIL